MGPSVRGSVSGPAGITGWIINTAHALYIGVDFLGNADFVRQSVGPVSLPMNVGLSLLLIAIGAGLVAWQAYRPRCLFLEDAPSRIDHQQDGSILRRASVGVRNGTLEPVDASLDLERAEPANAFTPIPLAASTDLITGGYGTLPTVRIAPGALVTFDVAVKPDDDDGHAPEFVMRYVRREYNHLSRGRHVLYLRPTGAGHNALSGYVLDINARGQLTFRRERSGGREYLPAILAGVLTLALLIAFAMKSPPEKTPKNVPPTVTAHETYAQMSNSDLRSHALRVVDGIRRMMAAHRTKDNELNAKDWEDRAHRDSDSRRHADAHTQYLRQSNKLREELKNQYERDFKSDAILLRDEIMSRLSAEARERASGKTTDVLPRVYEWGGMPDVVADHLEQIAKMLPDELGQTGAAGASPVARLGNGCGTAPIFAAIPAGQMTISYAPRKVALKNEIAKLFESHGWQVNDAPVPTLRQDVGLSFACGLEDSPACEFARQLSRAFSRTCGLVSEVHPGPPRDQPSQLHLVVGLAGGGVAGSISRQPLRASEKASPRPSVSE